MWDMKRFSISSHPVLTGHICIVRFIISPDRSLCYKTNPGATCQGRRLFNRIGVRFGQPIPQQFPHEPAALDRVGVKQTSPEQRG